MVKRSRTGCITCRIRRVKCDETKPECIKCVGSGRVCDGYLPEDTFIPRRKLVTTVQNLSTIGPVSQALISQSRSPSRSLSLSRSPSPGRQDPDFFDIFRHHTAPNTSSFLPSDFWNLRVLQLAHAEPAIWHATVAVGALHRRFDLMTKESTISREYLSLTRRAEEHHGKALALAKDLDSAPKLVGLALTLMASANLLGRLKESQVHVLAGLRTAREIGDQGGSGVNALTRMLSRMDMQAMTFSDSESPYPFHDAIRIQAHDHKVKIQDYRPETYEEAASDLISLLKRSMLIDEEFSLMGDSEQTYFSKLGILLQDLHGWEFGVSLFESKYGCDPASTPAIGVRLYHALLRLVLKVTMLGPERRWDSGLAYYERMTVLAREIARRRYHDGKPWLSLEMGLIVPLYFAAYRCRHRFLRREALGVLLQLNCQEGMWPSHAAGNAVKLIIATEEQLSEQELESSLLDLPLLLEPGDSHDAALFRAHADLSWQILSSREIECLGPYSWHTEPFIPENLRVKEVLILSQWQNRKADMKLLMGSLDPTMPFGAVLDKTVRY